MELVRFADRTKKRRKDRPGEDAYLTRRMFLFKGLIATSFTVLTAKLGKMQVVDAQRYEVEAEENKERFLPLRAPRGLIIDRKGHVLAENRVNWTVSVIPAQLPEKDDPRRDYVREQVINALDLQEMLVVRKKALPSESGDAVVESLAEATGEDPQPLKVKLENSDADWVVIREGLSPEESERFRTLDKQLPGVHVMNHFDYVVEANRGEILPVDLKTDVPRDIALALVANSLYLPGIEVSDDRLVRQYPAGPEFSHILGYVSPIQQEEWEAAEESLVNPYLMTDVIGRGGIEQAMQQDLHGVHGGRWILVDARGVEVSELHDRRQEAQPGHTVQLTIDRDFQRAVTAALQEGIEQANEGALRDGKEPVGAGVAVALDPRNGEVLALVSLPNYDNQLFVDGISQEQYQAYLEDPYKPLTNFAISGAFPPGSTIKPMFASAALQEGTIDPTTQYRCTGQIRVPTIFDEAGGNYYVCWVRQLGRGHGPVAVEEAIAQSCDVFFYNVGAPGQIPEGGTEPLHYYIPGDPQPHYFEGLGIDRMERYLEEDFGFGAPTGIELAGEIGGLVPNPKWLFQSPLHEYWSVGDTINVSIGQGHFSSTPLQLCCATAAIANGSTYYRPRLVKAVKDATGRVVREFPPEARNQLSMAPEHIQVVRSGMRRTVTDGTAKGKFTKTGNDVPIAGKTGTAEYGRAVDGEYSKQHAWFTAFAPFNDPEIVVTVLIRGGGEGSTYAIPVADAILAAFFARKDRAA